VKAWQVAPDQKSLVLAAEMPLSARATCMQMANPNFILISLENGNLAGWDLNANKIDTLPAHSGPNSAISHL